VYSKHSNGLKLTKDTELTSANLFRAENGKLIQNCVSTYGLKQTERSDCFLVCGNPTCAKYCGHKKPNMCHKKPKDGEMVPYGAKVTSTLELTCGNLLGRTRIVVQRTFHVSQTDPLNYKLFIIISHTVRSCGILPGQPMQCLEIKSSKCVWSNVRIEKWNAFNTFQPGKKIKEIGLLLEYSTDRKKDIFNPAQKGQDQPEKQDQLCGSDSFLELTTSREI